MPANPATVLRLTAEIERATAALRAYLDDASAEPEDDLVSLKDAETEYRRSNDTLRRWATEEELGVKVDGKWFLSRSLVRRFKSA